LKLLQDDVLLSEFKENAYQRSLEFSLDKVVPMYEEVYQRALCQSRK